MPILPNKVISIS